MFLSTPNPLSLFHLPTVLLAGDVHLNPGPNLSSNLLLCTLNTRSMLTPLHITALNDLTDNVKPDVLAITETWIRATTTTAELIDSTPPGYFLFSAPRTSASHPSKTTSGGGTAFLVKEPATILNSTAHFYSSFEYSSITFKITKTLLTIFNIYHPPPPSPHSQPFSTFLNQFSSFLSSATTTLHDFIIAGDFNIHVDDPLDSQSIQFSDLLDSTNLIQHIHISTHKQGHTLGLLITHVNFTLNPIISSSVMVISDHVPILSSINIIPNPPPPATTFTYRRLNKINYHKFICDLNSTPLITNPPELL